MEGLRTKVTGEQKSEVSPCWSETKGFNSGCLSEVRKHALGEMDIAHSPGRKNAK